MYFRNYRLWKTWLDRSLQSAVAEHPLTINAWNSSKYLRNLHENTYNTFLMVVGESDLENLSHSDMWNLRGAS